MIILAEGFPSGQKLTTDAELYVQALNELIGSAESLATSASGWLFYGWRYFGPFCRGLPGPGCHHVISSPRWFYDRAILLPAVW